MPFANADLVPSLSRARTSLSFFSVHSYSVARLLRPFFRFIIRMRTSTPSRPIGGFFPDDVPNAQARAHVPMRNLQNDRTI